MFIVLSGGIIEPSWEFYKEKYEEKGTLKALNFTRLHLPYWEILSIHSLRSGSDERWNRFERGGGGMQSYYQRTSVLFIKERR